MAGHFSVPLLFQFLFRHDVKPEQGNKLCEDKLNLLWDVYVVPDMNA